MDQNSLEERRAGLELKQFNRALLQVLLLPIVACLVLASILVWQIQQSNSIVGMIETSDLRIALASRIESLVLDEETGLRGYQTTADPRFLQPYLDAETPLNNTVRLLDQNANPAQKEALRRFVLEHEAWRDGFAAPVIATIRAGGRANDDDLNLTGRARMDNMRALLESIIQSSEQRRTARSTQWHKQSSDIFFVLIALALAIGIFMGLFARGRLQSVSDAFRRALDLQHRRTEELFQSEQNLRTTLASIGDGVITCDVEGKVQMMNPVAQDLTGWPESQARNRPLQEVFQILHEETREPVENPVAKVQRLNRIVGIANHTILVRKDGSEICIDDSGAPIRDETGELVGVVMVFRDITMERRTRAALLANEKLAVAGRLAATIAHEIHNPLDSVANLLYLLQQNPDEADRKQFLELAQSELTRVTHISRAMLSLYRESKAPVPVNLHDLLGELLLLMENRFQMMGIHATSDIPADVIVEGFPAELRQVFTNVLTNAAEASGEGGSIHVRVVRQEASPNGSGHRQEAGALVEVTDSGPGIAPDVQEHLFQPFFTTKGERGTGLGLWVSQGIIRKHGGTLELVSNDGNGHGATARIFLASRPIIEPVGD